MKKIIWLFAIPIYLIACKDHDSSNKQTVGIDSTTKSNCPCNDTSAFKSVLPIDRVIAKQIIGNFKYHKTNKIDSVWTIFSKRDLLTLLSKHEGDSVKFFMGAYNDDYSTNQKKTYPTILLQIQVMALTGIEFLYYPGANSCPPPDSPPGCNCEAK